VLVWANMDHVTWVNVTCWVKTFDSIMEEFIWEMYVLV